MLCPKNLDAQVKGAGYLTHNLVAAAASDNSEKIGEVIDRLGFQSAVVFINWNTTCTDAKKLTATVKRYQSADNTNWDAAETIQAATDLFVASNPTLTGKGLIEIAQDLSGCKRYVKYSVTADLDAANTDVAAYGLVAVLGGSDSIPV